jgi:hypothetical protein
MAFSSPARGGIAPPRGGLLQTASLESKNAQKTALGDEVDVVAGHKGNPETVPHAAGEFARDDDGDGSCEVHVNTPEEFGSSLRSWLGPHRGISQEELPLDLGFFEFVHNVRVRGKALLGELIGLFVSSPRILA